MSTDDPLPYPGPPRGSPPPSPPARELENGAGVAALVLGIVAAASALAGWLIITIPVALAAGGLAIYFGIRGRRLAARGQADNPGRSLAGLILGSVAVGLVVIGGTAFAVKGGEWGHEWDDHDRDSYSFDRCLDEADGRGDLAECLRRFPADARSLGVTVQP